MQMSNEGILVILFVGLIAAAGRQDRPWHRLWHHRRYSGRYSRRTGRQPAVSEARHPPRHRIVSEIIYSAICAVLLLFDRAAASNRRPVLTR